MLGKVVEASAGLMVVELSAGQECRRVVVDERSYAMVDHGYATTVHKSQGATVDRVKLLASLSLDRHLTYVAMTRHREDLSIYYGRRPSNALAVLSKSSRDTMQRKRHSTMRAPRFIGRRCNLPRAGPASPHVARAVLRHRLEWTQRQGVKLAALAGRLKAEGLKIGRAIHAGRDRLASRFRPRPGVRRDKPSRSVAAVVEERLGQDLALKGLWQEVANRIHLVYAEPRQAAEALNLQALLTSDPWWSRAFKAEGGASEIREDPGQDRLLAGPGDRQERERAEKNIAPLVEACATISTRE